MCFPIKIVAQSSNTGYLRHMTTCRFQLSLFFMSLGFIFFTSVNVCTAQANEQDSLERSSFFGGYPIAFFTPETRWGFGAAGVFTHFPGKNKSIRPSQWQVGGAYTLNRQILSFCFYNVFLDQDKHNFFGEFGYYDYFFQYYGTGNQTVFEDEELYSAKFPRIQINYLRALKSNFYLGGFYHYDNYNIFQSKENGILESSQISGFEGSVISRVGVIFRLDDRDNIFYPNKGTFGTINLLVNSKTIGATQNYQSITFDLSKYLSFGKNIFAFNLWSGQQFGDVPFQDLLPLGGAKKARGIITGRYRDKSVLLLQGEYRFPIFWRFYGAAFISTGNVANQYSLLFEEKWKVNYGLGIRFRLDKENKTNVRVDFALGSDESNFYFTVNEAF